LKKASPDPSPPPSHHLGDLTESFIGEHPALRQNPNAERASMRWGKTTLLEMLVFKLLQCRSFLPLEEDSEDVEDAGAPRSADGARRPTPIRHSDILSS
jgi:hypothetical protein